MYLSAQEIHQDFHNRLRKLQLTQDEFIDEKILPAKDWVEILETQISSRIADLYSRVYKTRDQTFYTISSAGHEMMSLVGKASRYNDLCYAHYRDASFYLQRALKVHECNPLFDLIHSFVVSKSDQISGGRHKVLGNAKLFMPPQTSTIASHLPKAVGSALSIPRSKDLKLVSYLPYDSVVTCHFGDATLNHATALTAINCAHWLSYNKVPTPIVFVCEDNEIGISQKTTQGWINEQMRGKDPHIKYFYVDFTDLNLAYQCIVNAYHFSRKNKRPVFLHLKMVRLYGHAGNDREDLYRKKSDILNDLAKDPIIQLSQWLINSKAVTKQELVSILDRIDQQILSIYEKAIKQPKLQSRNEIMASLIPNFKKPAVNLVKHNLNNYQHPNPREQYTLAQSLNQSLHEILGKNPQACLIGLDIGKKGGVYNITSGLFKKFGPARVMNAPLDETTILGTGIGMSLNGFLPICEIQFLAYYHNAQDQIRGEASTLSFFSQGQFQNGIVIRIPGLAYQEGLGGHFHNDNTLSVFRDIPAVIIACPSNAKDASAMLKTCVEQAKQGRICFFIEPIALYHKKDLLDEKDEKWLFEYNQEEIQLGQIKVYSHSKASDQLIITYGNGLYLSRQAQEKLNERGIKIDVIDLRWLNCYQQEKLVEIAQKYKKILIVDECREKAALADELYRVIASACPQSTVTTLCSADSFISLGPSAKKLLVSTDEIIERISP